MKKLEVTVEVLDTKDLSSVAAIVDFCSMSEALNDAYGSCSCSSCCN